MAASLSWFFAQNEHGSDYGYHDAGIETFRDNLLGSLARETIQNSLDACRNHSKPVEVKFDLVQLPVSNVPDAASLDASMKRAGKYWSHDPKAVKFFKSASALLSKPKIPVLRVSDHNTTGLVGSDSDRKSNWYSLIRCFGASSKYEGEGGSFGIGKNAPFAASKLQTLIYSTVTEKKKRGFIGVARLATHPGEDKIKVNPDGYLGVGTGQMVTDETKIPKRFRRDDSGTTLAILGFDGGDNWVDELILSIVENFWPAIYHKKLIASVGKNKINSSNIEELLVWAAQEHGSTAVEFLRCLISEESFQIDHTLDNLRDVTLYLQTSDSPLPKRVAMVRKPGMIVHQRGFHSRRPYCGVFFCENDVGNAILRDMEPPRHDRWSPDLPSKGENRKIDREIVEFIRSEIHALSDDDEQESIDVPDLGRFLPDQLDEHGQREEAEGDEAAEMADNVEIPTSPIGSRPSRPTSTELGDLGPEHTEGPSSDNDDDDDDEPELSDTDPSSPGDSEGSHQQADVPLESRAIILDRRGAKYSLLLRAGDSERHRVNIAVRVVGEEGSEPIAIGTASIKGKRLKIESSGIISGVSMKKGEAATLEITLAEPRRVSLEVIANEA